jgi:hypothetical protein
MNMRNITYPLLQTLNINASILKVEALVFTNNFQNWVGASIPYNITDETSTSGFCNKNNTRNIFFEFDIYCLKAEVAITDLWQAIIFWCRRKTRKYG